MAINWQNIAKEHGYSSSRELLENRYARTQEERTQGKLGCYRLAKVLGISHSAVRNELVRLGISRAPVGGPQYYVHYHPELFGFKTEKEMFLHWRVVERLSVKDIIKRLQPKLDTVVRKCTLLARFRRYGVGKISKDDHYESYGTGKSRAATSGESGTDFI